MKKHSLTFNSLYIYIILLILLPKSIPNLFGIIPVRTTLTYILFMIFMYDKYKHNIELNNINFKWLGITYTVFLVLTLPSLITTRNTITTIYTIVKFISYILFLYVCTKTKLTKEEYMKIIKTILLLALFKFIWGLIEYIFEINLSTIGAYKYPGCKGRVRAFFFNTIYYGIFINLIFAYMLYLFNTVDDKKKKIILAILMYLAFINIMLTFTRSTFLVFWGIIFLMFVFLRKVVFNKKTLGILFICIVTAFMIPGSNIFMLASINDITRIVLKNNPLEKLIPQDKVRADDDSEIGDLSLEHRKLFAKTGIAIGKDNMLTGIGFGSYIDYLSTDEFKIKYPKYSDVKTHPHSSFVLMFSEVGILALIAFLSFIGVITIKIIKNIKLNHNIGYIILSITIGFYLVNIIAENVFYDTQMFPMYLLVLGLTLSYITNITKKVKE